MLKRCQRKAEDEVPMLDSLKLLPVWAVVADSLTVDNWIQQNHCHLEWHHLPQLIGFEGKKQCLVCTWPNFVISCQPFCRLKMLENRKIKQAYWSSGWWLKTKPRDGDETTLTFLEGRWATWDHQQDTWRVHHAQKMSAKGWGWSTHVGQPQAVTSTNTSFFGW